uniref:Uncharacterized protein n=1 Tax=Chromera velia CCMP2878 TaxID=1169474 RepID=A0A0G4F182_9ALVE|eukprot:Cvel_2609.t1-p1 / transcript=Cvel_2609.t1 / gene=Cvel_2609 / organism=Chromera_velia_CCMP2878 / gene_product=hypothetical protein / transcript_product=hypothetical protein / location=Cvel_scaffold103:66793-67068(+) / protein_length=92 / sequence_SO=supercontig / SO=protein_coding / is_pseudo=false
MKSRASSHYDRCKEEQIKTTDINERTAVNGSRSDLSEGDAWWYTIWLHADARVETASSTKAPINSRATRGRGDTQRTQRASKALASPCREKM